jgi:BirA family biotin operon repressor/biotin-[acetyl-CoA-carboxylase] ligase
VGIGINVTTRDFPEGLRNPAGSVLAENDPPIDQSLLCARIVEILSDLLRPDNAALCLKAYRKRLCMVGQRVICTRNFPADNEPLSDNGIQGILVGVDEDYGLILHLDNGTAEILRGGEISLKLKT